MDELSEGLKAELSPAAVDELREFLARKAQEAQDRECAMRATLENLVQFLAKMDQSIKAEAEQWQGERARTEAAIQADLRDREENIRLDHVILKRSAATFAGKAEMERQKLLSLPLAEEIQRVVSLLEKEFVYDYDDIILNDPERAKTESDNWIRWTQERVDSTLSMALTAATMKQQWLQQLKGQAEKRMAVAVPQVSDGPAGEVNTNIKLSLDDGLQSLSFSSQKAEKVIVQQQVLVAKIDTKMEKKMARLRAEAIKEEEKIRAAELKKRSRMEEKTRRKLEKIHKAELKEKKRREAKEKKEAEKLERKRAKEERGESRQSRCCFCCFC